MNENVNLSKILRDCLKGTKLYSPLLGVVKFEEISEDWNFVCVRKGKDIWNFTYDARFLFGISNSNSAEIMLFPSREQRNWSKFNVKSNKQNFDTKTLNPFDRVLARDSEDETWCCNLFSHITNYSGGYNYFCVGSVYQFCIPYNEDTKHLVCTSEEAPEFYRYWE